MKRLAILGSTGSIGRNTLQVVREMGGDVRVTALAAGSNVGELLRQAVEFRPEVISLADEKARDVFSKRLAEEAGAIGYRPEVLWGPRGNLAVATGPRRLTLSFRQRSASLGWRPLLRPLLAGRGSPWRTRRFWSRPESL